MSIGTVIRIVKKECDNTPCVITLSTGCNGYPKNVQRAIRDAIKHYDNRGRDKWFGLVELLLRYNDMMLEVKRNFYDDEVKTAYNVTTYDFEKEYLSYKYPSPFYNIVLQDFEYENGIITNDIINPEAGIEGIITYFYDGKKTMSLNDFITKDGI